MKEVEKMAAVRDESLTLSRFLDWLDDNGYWICEQTESEVRPWMPIRKGHEKLLADFFEIDLDKVEQEKLEILEDHRNATGQV